MSVLQRSVQGVRELGPVLLVAVGVVMAGVLAGAIINHNPRATAEERTIRTTTAIAGSDASQMLVITEWGVQVRLPLLAELPLVTYAGPTGDSIGFTSASLTALGPACAATNNPLGSLLRFPAGAVALPGPDGLTRTVMATVGDYVYVYQMPRSACTATDEGHTRVNRETSIIREALGGLTPIPGD